MNDDIVNYLNGIRRDFAGKPLNEGFVDQNPITQFESWFEEAVNAQLLDPYAMAITTVSSNGQPSIRIVYMRGLSDAGFVFYSNYNSHKGQDIAVNNKVSLNFFWGELERQIRIEGQAEKLDDETSDLYFSKRPKESQIGAWASNQSEELISRKELEDRIALFTEKFKNVDVPRPTHWGGYIVKPTKIEFWQGRPSRLHDRIVYTRSKNTWVLSRICP